MSNAVVTSVLARCVTDATFLSRMASRPGLALARYQLDERTAAEFSQLDLRRVRHFAAFVAKVKHNFLWDSFPMTVRFMKRAGIELSVFGDYLEAHQRNRAQMGLSIDEKIQRFVAFLRRFLRLRKCRGFQPLDDVLSHELAEWEVRRGATRPAVNHPHRNRTEITQPHFAASIPVPHGCFRVNRFRWNPPDLIAWLSGPADTPCPVPVKPRWLVYWTDSRGMELKVIEVDRFSAALLRAIDGRRSVRSVVRVASQGAAPPDGYSVREFLGLVRRVGLINFAPPVCGKRGAPP